MPAADDYHVEGTGLTKDEVTALLRGPAGSRVDLLVADAGGRARRVSLERRSLPQPPVKEVCVIVMIQTCDLCVIKLKFSHGLDAYLPLFTSTFSFHFASAFIAAHQRLSSCPSLRLPSLSDFSSCRQHNL